MSRFSSNGNKNKKNFFYLGSLIRIISLIGFPFFSGFFSKDFIIEYFFFSKKIFSFSLFLFSIFFSVVYRFRLIKKLLKIKWKLKIFKRLKINNFFLIFLLLKRIILGLKFSFYFKNLELISRKIILKLVIYLILILGGFFSNQNLNFWFLKSIFFLDSFQKKFMYFQLKKKFLLYQNIDQGVLPYFSEKNDIFWLKNFNFFIKKNIFYFFWIFLIIWIIQN